MDSGKLIEKKKTKERQEIHRRIEKLRKEIKKMSQPEFAVALGMDEKKGRVTINNWEQGLVSIKHEDIARIATTFNVSADWLIGISDVESRNPDIQTACDITGLSQNSVSFLNDLAEESKRERGFQERNILKLLNMLFNEERYSEIMEYWSRMQAFMFETGGSYILKLTTGDYPIPRDDVLASLLTMNNDYMMKLKKEMMTEGK